MKDFRRNKETGILEIWEDGKKIGEIITIGDEIGKVGKDEWQARNTVGNSTLNHESRK